MVIAVTITAILSVAVFIGLEVRRRSMTPKAIWLSAMLAAAVLAVAAFTLMDRLVGRLEEIYWHSLPLNWNLECVRLFFTGCSWFAVAALSGWAGLHMLNRPADVAPQDSTAQAGSRVVWGFALVLLALTAFVFAKSHVKDALNFSYDQITLPVWTYYALHSAAAVLAIAGVLLACHGFYLHAKRPIRSAGSADRGE